MLLAVDIRKTFQSAERRFTLDVSFRSAAQLIALLGPSGSGKTTVANHILETVSADEVVFIQQDLY